MLRPRWLAFAPTSSLMIVKTCWFQPRMTVWPDSITRERPLRRSSRRFWMPVLMMPIRALMTKIPPSVTTSIAPRNVAEPASPPIVPESRVRIRPIQMTSKTDRSWPALVPSPAPVATTITATITISSAETRNSPRIRAMVPRAKNSSTR